MTRIVHISDLHFGADDAELIEPLFDAVTGAEPNLIAVSGDLTQRARSSQFRAARAFLDRLPSPWICVPGNHDIPLHNPLMRWTIPYLNYRRFVDANLAPTITVNDVRVHTLNTSDPYSWQKGRLRDRQITSACSGFSGFDGVRVLMCHHPFSQSRESHKQLMPKAEETLSRLADCGTDLILSGHLHRWWAEPFVQRKGVGRILQVHVGTGLSTRRRGQENDFAILDFVDGGCRVHRMVAEGARFREDSVAWHQLNPKR
ncbi:metallophosphoesterase family protein [Amaricoccus tamworthensis]|uniref:metallophosphoesterase family protein n=1 Tax=Amaricoccus tamworthensis TaxID=57002 RepID=UPI003C79D51B